MKKIDSLKDIIGVNSSFKTAINLYLSLNDSNRLMGYIPTKSSLALINDYMHSVMDNKEQATLLIGPYGKGKSHLLLVLLAILSLDRNKENKKLINQLIKKIGSADATEKEACSLIKEIWDNKRFLPVLVSGTNGDLAQSFLFGLNEALKRNGLIDLAPETYYSVALDRIDDWENNYTETYDHFADQLNEKGKSISELRAELKLCNKASLDLFTQIYPKVTAGSEFNPLVTSDVLPLYKNISDKLKEDYGYNGLYVVFDEFSKFVEAQDGDSTGSNMKLIQDMCELAADSSESQIFFTMVAHKSIKEYGKQLSQELINSFTGIEGRIVEKYFVTSSKNNYELIKNAIVKEDQDLALIPSGDKFFGKQAVKEYYNLPVFKSSFSPKDFEAIVLRGCYPLNPISAYLLLNISEKVAQNERTLFTFISNDEANSMARFIANHSKNDGWSIGADLIYDYFEALFRKEVSNEFIHNIWLSAEYVIERCETDDEKKVAKALAIILAVNKEDEIAAEDGYIKISTEAADSVLALNSLVERKLIYKKSATGTYVFKTRAGSELKSEIKKQREIKGSNVNYSKALLDVRGDYYIVPRKYNAIHMMTRYFEHEYMNVDDFLEITNSKSLLNDCKGDGKVISLYSFVGIKQEQVNRHLTQLADSRIVVVCPKKGLKIQKQLRDYEIIQELLSNKAFTNDNEILKKELPILVDDLTGDIENVLEIVYDEDAETRVLYYNGERIKNVKVGNEEIAVNECCELTYFKTPIINNEMVNRAYIATGQTRKARVNIIQALLTHKDTEEFYSGSNQEATVYRSLFCNTGIVQGKPQKQLSEILRIMDSYIDSCCDSRKTVQKLVDKLISRPYGFRCGLIPIYLAYCISRRREDIIVYFMDSEVQLTADMLVNMCEAPDDYSLLVSKDDLQKEKYIAALNELFNVTENKNLTSDRIKDIVICMQRWFRALPQVSKNTVLIDTYISDDRERSAMNSIKRSLQKVEFNPFEILFVVFPGNFGADSLEKTYKMIDDCKTYYDDYYDWILERIVERIYELWGGKKKRDLFHTISEWYENQSDRSKQGLYSGRITNFMSCIEKMDVYSDSEVAKRVVKAATDVYVENWNVGAFDEAIETIGAIKKEIEEIRDKKTEGEMSLSFFGKDGKKIEKLYSYANEGTGSVLRNIIEDTLEEYSDLSVNDRVSILLEMIERIIK